MGETGDGTACAPVETAAIGVVQVKRDNTQTVARIAGQRWPRLLSPTLAAVYVGMSDAYEFRASEFGRLVFEFEGRYLVDKVALDAALDEKTRPGNGSNRNGQGEYPELMQYSTKKQKVK